MNNWQVTSLGSIATFRTGKLDSNAAEENGLYPFFTCSPETYKINTYAFDTEAVLLAGNNANAVYPLKYYMGKFNAYQRTYVIEPKSAELADCRYLYYLVSFLLQKLKEASVGSATKFLTKQILENFQVKVPPLEEQKAIAKILSSLDDKIELNRRMNATLEAMARALFKAWFVDFEPVYANLEHRPSTSASPEIAKLFPSEFENGIPKGWQLGSVSDLGDVVCGKTPSTKIADNFGDEIPFITIPDMHGNAVITKTARHLSKKGADSQNKKYLPAHSICVSCIATAGLVSMTSERSQTNQQINSVIPNGKFGTYFCYQVLNKLGEEIRTKGSGGSVFVNLNTGSFSKIPVLLPDEAISTSYHNISKPLFEKIVNNEKESHCLSEMRDSLLPRLISGQIQASR